jgi:hypothetical protein
MPIFPRHVIRVVRIAKVFSAVSALDQLFGVITALIAFWHERIDLEL